MAEVILYLAVSGIIFLLGVVIKYFKAYYLMPAIIQHQEEQQYMVRNKVLRLCGTAVNDYSSTLVGLILERAGFIWGQQWDQYFSSFFAFLYCDCRQALCPRRRLFIRQEG